MHFYVSTKDVQRRPIEGRDGSRLHDVLKDAGFYIPASCGGSMACSTCHVMLDEQTYANLPAACSDEEDVLDMLPKVTATSRLSCQIICGPSLEGAEVRVPDKVTNLLSK